MKNIAWDEIRRAFEEEGLSCREIARRFGVGYSTVTQHARREGWRMKHTQEVPTASLAEQLTDTVLAALEDIREQEKPDIRSIKELVAMLRDLRQLNKTAEDTRGGAEQVLRVELAPELKDWSE